jgi:CHASE3 domain sensor protein
MLAALIVLVFICLGLAGACFLLWQELKRQASRLAQYEETNEKRLKALARRLETYQAGTVRMGEQLHEINEIIAPLPDRLTRIEQSDPASLSFSQAARLAGLGASVDDLTQSCGLSRAEAELISKMHKARQQS